jgi:hypothetical protein
MVFDLFNADSLPSKDQAEIDLLSFVADAAACCGGNGLVVERIVEFLQVAMGS